ncbi:putative DNA-binding domain-containing protein [Niveispirillum fermenti]|uniref:HvfC/BufC family peptide modification chaperone n=1 Tax=Niveispirillum fermenti TaxID=1233113 RepID=UPI003A8C60D2
MLMAMQRSMLAACYGDPGGFAQTLTYLAPARVPVDKALYIHTATVTAALTGLLAQAYPSLADRLGPEGFADAARAHLRTHPPAQAVLALYGEGFGKDLPGELPLLAALDWAAHAAYFAADADCMRPGTLAGISPDKLVDLRLSLVPSVRLIGGGVAVLSAWRAGRQDIQPVASPVPLAGPEAAALVWRGPDLLVAVTLLPPDAVTFVRMVSGGAPLLEAAGALAAPDQFPPLLALLIGHGLIAAATGELT